MKPLRLPSTPMVLDPKVELALAIIESELHRPLLLSEISARVGVSASRLEHLFRRETGKTFKAHLRERRLAKAQGLLTDPTLSIKQIADAVGYTFARNFSRDFRKRFGCPPSRYRRLPVAGFAK